MTNFESFSRRLVVLAQNPHLTIQKRGTISLNKAAFVALHEPDAVELLFDRDKRMIGLRPTDHATEDSVKVRASTPGGNGPFVVSAAAFCAYYEIDITQSRRWDAYLDSGVLCADLSVAGEPVTSNRAISRRRMGMTMNDERHASGNM